MLLVERQKELVEKTTKSHQDLLLVVLVDGASQGWTSCSTVVKVVVRDNSKECLCNKLNLHI